MKLGKKIFQTKQAASKTVHYAAFGILVCLPILVTVFIVIPVAGSNAPLITKILFPAVLYLVCGVFFEIALTSFRGCRDGYLVFRTEGVDRVMADETVSYKWSDVVSINLSEKQPDMDESRFQIGLGLLTGNFARFGRALAAEKRFCFVDLQLPDAPARKVQAPDFRSWLQLDEALSESLPSYQRASRLQVRR